MNTLSVLKAAAPKVLHRAAGLALGALATVTLFAGTPRAEPAMWVVKDRDSTIYLFGTVHLLRPDVVWKTPKIGKAIADAQDLTLEITEVDDPQAMASVIQKYGLDPQHPLSTKLTPEDNARLDAACKSLGLGPQALDKTKPWMAAIFLEVFAMKKAGYVETSGIDVLLKAEATARKEPVVGFETAEQQMKYFDSLPQAVQVAYLRQVLDELPTMVERVDEIARAWEKGDVATIAKAMTEDDRLENPELYDRLMTRRNRDFARQIKAKLAGKGVSFVAVGAGHLAGPDSVQVQLKKLGVKAKRY